MEMLTVVYSIWPPKDNPQKREKGTKEDYRG